jgi:hypothetical protein
MRPSSIAHISFWIVALTAFVLTSAPRLCQLASTNVIRYTGPLHSTDNFLCFDTKQPNASEKLLALFDSIPTSESVVIFTRNDDRRSPFIGMMIAYLAWPHPVRIVDVTDRSSSNAGASDFPAPAICIFCRVTPPPSFRDGEDLGETVKIFKAARLARR